MRKMKLAIAAVIAGLALGEAQAHAQAAYAATDTGPMWWGTAGNHADLVLYYDFAAPKPVTLIGFYVLTVGPPPASQGIVSCGATTAAGQVLQPGGYCFLRAYRSGGSVVGRIVGTNTTSNVAKYMHGSLEIRDANDNTLQRSDAK